MHSIMQDDDYVSREGCGHGIEHVDSIFLSSVQVRHDGQLVLDNFLRADAAGHIGFYIQDVTFRLVVVERHAKVVQKMHIGPLRTLMRSMRERALPFFFLSLFRFVGQAVSTSMTMSSYSLQNFL